MKLTQAILPVAGYGTRFLPWTKVVPKELLPIGRKPIIALLVDECLSVGIRDICFVISKGKEAIPDFFKTDAALESALEKLGKKHLLEELTKYHDVQFTTVYQDEMKGDGHAILQAADWVKSDHVAILFGDDLIAGEKTGLKQLAEAGKSAGEDAAIICLSRVKREEVSKYGIVEIASKKTSSRVHEVTGLVEKPQPENAPSDLSITGKYIVPRSTIEALRKAESGHRDGEIRLIDALSAQLKSREIRILGVECEGTRYDTGTWEGYRQAVTVIG